MPRAKSTDFLHSFRFHVIVTGFGVNANQNILGSGADSATGRPSAGFNACSAPEATEEAVEYREGHYIYTRKFTGLPSVADVSLSRGVALNDGTFWSWLKDVIEGNAEYRANVSIRHFHRDSKPQSTSSTAGTPNSTNANTNVDMGVTGATGNKGYIEYVCNEVFPTRHKVSSDFDSTSSEVSIQELDLSMEYFNIIDHGAV